MKTIKIDNIEFSMSYWFALKLKKNRTYAWIVLIINFPNKILSITFVSCSEIYFKLYLSSSSKRVKI